jgi:hypothetical protein
MVVGVIHLVASEYGLETTLVEGFVVGHERQALDTRRYLLPYVGKDRGTVGVGTREPMHTSVPIKIVVGLGLNERIKRVYNLTSSHNDNAYRAHTGALGIGRFKIYGCKIEHEKKRLTFGAGLPAKNESLVVPRY